MAIRKPIIIKDDGNYSQLPNGDVVVSAITDTNGKFTATTVDGVIDEIGTLLGDHEHVAADITDFDTEVANNTAVAANTDKDTNVPTALSIGTRAATTLGITSDGGANDVVLPAANTTEAGLMTDAQFDKLAGIATGAEVNNISSANVTDLTDGNDSTLHYHASDRNRTNHTGTQLAATISDFESTVETAGDVVSNTAHTAIVDGNPHGTDKDDLGLGNVTNVEAIPLTQKGANSGVAELNASGLVPSTQLPSYVDDVILADNKAALVTENDPFESGKIYIAKDTNLTFRWDGSGHTEGDLIEISSSLALGETDSTAYRGDRGKTAYDHSQESHAPAGAEVNVKSDWTGSGDAEILNKPTTISAQQATDITTNNGKNTNVSTTIALGTRTTTTMPLVTDGQSVDLIAATTNYAGLMTDAQFDKLAGIEATADITDATNVTTAGAVMKTLINNKGELLAGTADDTVGILAAGTNGQILVVDSNESTGLKWVVNDVSGSTDLSIGTNNTTELSITTDGSVDDVTLPNSSSSLTGVMTSAQFDKLAGIEAGAEVNNISDANATLLTGGNTNSLHYHSSDRARTNHTGTQLAATISDLGEAISKNVALTLEAGEALSAGDFVYIYNDTGAKVMKSDATTSGKAADGFVKEAVTLGNDAEVFPPGEINDQLSGLTIGADYFMAVISGDITETAPSAAGNIVQKLGKAHSTTAIQFVKGHTTELT